MTERQRQDLLMACAFAKTFIDHADNEIRAAKLDVTPLLDTCRRDRLDAQAQLMAALLKLERA